MDINEKEEEDQSLGFFVGTTEIRWIFFCGCLIIFTYPTQISTSQSLLETNIFYGNEIRNNVEELWLVQRTSIVRAREWIRLGGGHIPPTYEIHLRKPCLKKSSFCWINLSVSNRSSFFIVKLALAHRVLKSIIN